jgi:ankyrin repeat protein
VDLLAGAAAGDEAAVRVALQQGARIHSFSCSSHTLGWTPLHLAAAGGHAGVVRALLEAGASPLQRTKDLDSRLNFRTPTGGGAPPEDLPLHTAALARQVAVTEALLAHPSREEQLLGVGKAHDTALHIASAGGDVALCTLLCDAGASPLLKTDMVVDPWSRRTHRVDAVDVARDEATKQVLLAAVQRASVSVQDRMFPAAKSSAPDALQQLLLSFSDEGARAAAVRAVDERRRTPAHYAARNANHTILWQLLEHGALPHVPDADGNTPMHLAAHSGGEECVRALMAAWPRGTLRAARNAANDTPADLANGVVLELLREFCRGGPVALFSRLAFEALPATLPLSVASTPSPGRAQRLVPEDLGAWLEKLKLEEYGHALVDKWKLASLLEVKDLVEPDLEACGLLKTERRRFLRAAAELPEAGDPLIRALSSPMLSASTSCASSASDGLGWDFFLSHYQANAGPQIGQLYAELKQRGKRAWYDKIETPHLAGMMKGVRNSAVFVIYLTRDYFTRTFCRMELLEAIEQNKPLVLLRETEERLVFQQDDADKVTLHTVASIKELGLQAGTKLGPIFEHLVAIEVRQLVGERMLMLDRLCHPDTPVKLPPELRAAICGSSTAIKHLAEAAAQYQAAR